MVTRGSVLETFPLLYNRAGLAPADYETVSNRAMSAVQPDSLSSACSAATNYTDAATNALAHGIAAQSALSAPVLYLADDGRIFNRIRDDLYLCQDGSYLDYDYPYYDTEIWRYGLGDGSYVFCYDAQDRPATNPAPPSVIKWGDSGVPAGSATLKTVLSAFPLYAPAADLAAATNAVYNEIARIDYEARVGEVLTNRLGAVSIGYHAKASAGGFGAVAIGSNTTATANCTVAIGANSDATATAGIAIGCDAGASGANGIAVGLGAAATAQKGIAIGQGAKAYASSAVQIGTGSNSAEETVNFFGVCVFSNGTLVVEGGGGETPAEISVTDTVPYSAGLVHLTVNSGDTLAVDGTGWANGAQVMVDAVLPATYTVGIGIAPTGYSAMPSDGHFLLVFTRLGMAYYVSTITSVE